MIVLAVPALFAALALAPSCLLPPVDAPILDHFRPPSCLWCPGNRGLQYDVAPGTPVRAAAAGTVTFSGSVAGRNYLVIEHTDGVRATYGDLAGSSWRTGAEVAAGAVVGSSNGGLHFGLRRGDEYLDPEPLLARVVRRVRLVPTDGTPARPAPPPRVRCPSGGES